jgi:hypothetical protein
VPFSPATGLSSVAQPRTRRIPVNKTVVVDDNYYDLYAYGFSFELDVRDRKYALTSTIEKVEIDE